MNGSSILRRTIVVAVMGGTLLAGCVTQKPLYQWEGYQPQVYQYFNGEAKEAQVAALEADLQKIRATDGAVPPGYYAHLGLLYSNLGKDDQMVKQFQAEKALFPESSTYMDFLLKNVKTGDQK